MGKRANQRAALVAVVAGYTGSVTCSPKVAFSIDANVREFQVLYFRR